LLEGIQVVSSIAVVAASVCFSLGVYVKIKNPYLKSSKLFFLITMIATITSIADLLIINAPDEGVAQAVAHPLVFLSTALAATMLYLTAYLPYEREGLWLVRHKREYAAISIFIGLVPALFISTVAEDQYGWWISLGLVTALWYAAIYMFYLAGIVSMVRLYMKEERRDVKDRILPLILAMAMPIVFDLALGVPLLFGERTPPDLSLAVLASGILFAYCIFKQKLFMVRPVKEESVVERPLPVMRPGQCVLVEGATGDCAYGMFVNELASSGRGLLITPTRPERIMEMYGLKSTPVLWLTSDPGPDSIDPSNLNVLMHAMTQFLKKSGDSVVLLDGLECLRSSNDPKAVMHLLYGLRDTAIVAGSKLIVTVDPRTMGSKDLIMLERDLDPIKA
jgi:hypothetical protein